MANVVIELTGKEASLVRAWQRSKQSVDEFNRAMDGAQAKGNKLGGILGDMPVKFATGLGTTVSAVGALTAAANLLKNEYDAMVQRQNAALGTQVRYARVQRAVLDNFLPDESLDTEGLEKALIDVPRRTGADPKAVAEGIGKALSAKGGSSNADAIAAASAVFDFNSIDEEGGKAMAPGVVTMMNAYKLNAKMGLGALLKLKGTSRIETDQDLGTKAATAGAQQAGFGDTWQHANALYSYLSNTMGDATGGRVDSAQISLSTQLERMLPHLRDTQERIAFMRSTDPKAQELRETLLGKIEEDMRTKGTLTGEASAFIPIRSLLSPEKNDNTNTYDKMLAEQGETKDLESYVDKRKAENTKNKLQQMAIKDRQAKTEKELNEIEQTESGEQALTRQTFEDFLNNANIPKALKDLYNLEYGTREMAGEDPRVISAEILDRVAKDLESPRELAGAGRKKTATRLGQDKDIAKRARAMAQQFLNDPELEDSEEGMEAQLNYILQNANVGSFRRSIISEEYRRRIREDGKSPAQAFQEMIDEEVEYQRSRGYHDDANKIIEQLPERTSTEDQRERDVETARQLLSQVAKRTGRLGDEKMFQDAFTRTLEEARQRNPNVEPFDVYRQFVEGGAREMEREGDDAAADEFRRSGGFTERLEGIRKPTVSGDPTPSPAASESDKLLDENNRRIGELTEVLRTRFSSPLAPQVPRPLAIQDFNRPLV